MKGPLTRSPRLRILFVLGGVLASALTHAQTWHQVRSPNFVVLSDAGESKARAVAREFEEIREIFRTALPSMRSDPTRPIVIYALEDEDGLRELIPWYWEDGRAQPFGIFLPRPDKYRIALRTDAFGSNRFQTIYHEYFHLLASVNYPRLPIWANEGLASFWEETVIRGDHVELGNANWAYLDLLQSKPPIPLAEVVGATQNPHVSDPRRVSTFYAQTWAFVHWTMLGEDPTAREKFFDYLFRVNAGERSLTAFEAVFGDIERMDFELRRYVRVPQKSAMRMDLPVEADEDSFTAAALTEAESLARKGNFLAVGQSREKALPLLERALALDPRSALAYEGLAYYHWYGRDNEQRDAWLNKALEADSQSYYVHFLGAMASDARRGSSEGHDRSKAVTRLERAIELNPRFAQAYLELSRIRASNPGTLDQAFRLARTAVELDPGAPSNWVNVGRILLELGIKEEAAKAAARARSLTPADASSEDLSRLERDIEGALGTMSVRGQLRELRCIAQDYFEFVIETSERVYVLFATEPSGISLTEDGQGTLKDIHCGSLSYVVEATYSPASRSPSGTDVDGELSALEFPPNQ